MEEIKEDTKNNQPIKKQKINTYTLSEKFDEITRVANCHILFNELAKCYDAKKSRYNSFNEMYMYKKILLGDLIDTLEEVNDDKLHTIQKLRTILELCSCLSMKILNETTNYINNHNTYFLYKKLTKYMNFNIKGNGDGYDYMECNNHYQLFNDILEKIKEFADEENKVLLENLIDVYTNMYNYYNEYATYTIRSFDNPISHLKYEKQQMLLDACMNIPDEY